MEVTTLSPSPISPTEGGDPCEIDVSSVAIHSVALLISLCGLAGNGAVLRILTLKTCDIRIFDLAVMDFLFLLLTFPSALLFLVEDVSCSPIMSLVYLSFLFQLSVVSYYWGLFRLTGFSFLSDMILLCQLCCRCRLPGCLLWVLDSVQYWAFFTLITVIPSVTSLCPSDQQEQCRAALISIFTIILLLFAAPMVISSTIKFIKAKCGSQQKEAKQSDIVIFLLVLFTLLLSLCNFLQELGYIVMSSHVFFLLACIHSSIKPFIYFLAEPCCRSCSVQSLRESLRRVFDEPEENTPSRNDAAMDTVI